MTYYDGKWCVSDIQDDQLWTIYGEPTIYNGKCRFNVTTGMNRGEPVPGENAVSYTLLRVYNDVSIENDTGSDLQTQFILTWMVGSSMRFYAIPAVINGSSSLANGSTLTIPAGTYMLRQEGTTTWTLNTDGYLPASLPDATSSVKGGVMIESTPIEGSTKAITSGGVYAALNAVHNLAFHICTNGEYNPSTGVPTIVNPDPDTFYLVADNNATSDIFVEWVYVGGAWEIFGSARLDLSDYALVSDLTALQSRVADLEYVPITINSVNASPSKAEIGSTVTSVALTYNMNRAATQMKLDGNAIENTAQTGTISLSGLSLTSNKMWTLQATDERKSQNNEWVSRTAYLTFTNKVKYGAAAVPGTINDSFLNGLTTKTLSTGKIGIITVNAGSGQYIWYALPTSYGECTFTVGGFTGGFTQVAQFNHTNESGATVEYRVYRSDNANLGSQTVSIS